MELPLFLKYMLIYADLFNGVVRHNPDGELADNLPRDDSLAAGSGEGTLNTVHTKTWEPPSGDEV